MDMNHLIKKLFFQKSSSKSLKEKEVLPVSLSYDHRLINGVYGAQFVTSLDAILQDTKLFEKI